MKIHSAVFGYFVHNALMDVANAAGAPQDFEAPNKQFHAEVIEAANPAAYNSSSTDLLFH
jgi:DNA-binding GntR family transcriptional regulator